MQFDPTFALSLSSSLETLQKETRQLIAWAYTPANQSWTIHTPANTLRIR